MRRRAFLTFVGGTAAVWQLAARAQRPTMPVIGFLNSTSSGSYAERVEAFREGLKDTRHVEGQNVAMEYRWAENKIDRLSAMAADLVQRKVSVIAAGGSPASALAAKLSTTSIPIVFMNAADPVQLGLVASLSRPGGNITGVTTVSTQLEAKRLGLLRELVPSATSIAVLVNPARPGVDAQSAQIKEAGRALGLPLHILQASSEREFDAAFQTVFERRAGALAIAADALFVAERDQIVALAKRYSVVTMYELREYVAAGGLISYGASGADVYRQGGTMVGRILNGERPADMPVLQPTKFELVINMKAARAFGVAIPPGVLAIADEVIE
jgi:putative ABC transport system substrate-binding protein